MQFRNAINSAANCVLYTTLHKNVFILSFTTKDPLGMLKDLGGWETVLGKILSMTTTTAMFDYETAMTEV